MSKLQTNRRSLEASSEASYCERETYDDDWGSRSTLSQLEEVATHSSGRCDTLALRAERDALARALAAERARAAAAARAHDARLAELHGVIAELVRRRAQDKHSAAIPEEDGSDECESTTQPAGELEHDGDPSRTEQNDTSSALSGDVTGGRGECRELPDDTTDTSTQEPLKLAPPPAPSSAPPPADSLQMFEREDELCLNTARCCQYLRQGAPAASGSGGGSCERERGSPDAALCAASPGRSEARQAKIASRVKLRRTEDEDSTQPSIEEQGWCADAAEKLALDVCAQADLREALVAASNDAVGIAWQARVEAWKARCARLEADCRLMECALTRATDTAHKLSCACAIQESSCVALCSALRAADRALETYDVLLALAETQPGGAAERAAAELVARRLLARLEAAPAPAVGEPLLSPGPWLQHHTQSGCEEGWSPAQEQRLRAHAARLKADTVALRNLSPPPQLLSYHEIESEGELPASGADPSLEMEQAVEMQELLAGQESYAALRARDVTRHAPPPARRSPAPPAAPAPPAPPPPPPVHVHEPQETRRRRHKHRHWLDAASETDL